MCELESVPVVDRALFFVELVWPVGNDDGNALGGNAFRALELLR